jgi:hypothetical protein
MPRAKVKNAPGLDIVFAPGTPNVLLPGQTLSGTVTLTTTGESVSIGSVVATFYGRGKVKIFQSHGQSSSEYRSRANFFRIDQELFRSDYTFGPGEYSWPFSIQLPYVADEQTLKASGKRRERFKPHDDFLSTDNVDIVEHELPPSMYHFHGMFGRAAWAYVEYVLEATVKEAENTHTIRSAQTRTSIRPIRFQPGRREEILTDYSPRSDETTLTIRSSKLTAPAPDHPLLSTTTSNPSNNDTRTSPVPNPTTTESRTTSSLRNLLTKVPLASSNTPKLTLTSKVTYPTTLQVHHPESFPLTLSITPNLHPQATTLGPGAPSAHLELLPTLRIRSLDLTLIATTKCRALTGLWQENDSKTVAIPIAKSVPLNHLLPPLTRKSSLADTNTTKSAKTKTDTAADADTLSQTAGEASVNLGALTPLRLSGARLGRVQETVLTPSFKTYNVTRQYGLRWTIEVEIVCPARTFLERIKGEVPRGGVLVRGVPDALREEVLGGMDVGGEELEGRDEDEEADEVGSGEKEVKGVGGRRGLFGRGGKNKEKETYAAEDRLNAEPQEDLPRYEA